MSRDNLNYVEIMRAEQKPDVYAGPNCDEHKARWWIHADGDMDSEHVDRFALSAADFPPGTKVVVTVPCCPLCGSNAELCVDSDCCFDWKEWANGRYS